MNFFIIYFFSYFLNFFGFSLGKSTLEEHKEIKKNVLFTSQILILILYSILIILFIEKIFELIIIVSLLNYYLFSLKHHKKYFLEFHEILIYSITLIFLNHSFKENLLLGVIPIIYMIIRNSFEKFHLKKEIYKIVLVFIIYIIFKLIFKYLENQI